MEKLQNVPDATMDRRKLRKKRKRLTKVLSNTKIFKRNVKNHKSCRHRTLK